MSGSLPYLHVALIRERRESRAEARRRSIDEALAKWGWFGFSSKRSQPPSDKL
jgi:hypothetical protein